MNPIQKDKWFNPMYRELVLSRAQAAVGAAGAISTISHNMLRGILRETLIRDLLRPLFPPNLGIGTGVLISPDQAEASPQQDVVIYDRSVLPPVLYEQNTGVFPLESVLFTIEVKSKLTKEELKSSHISASRLKKMKYLGRRYDNEGKISPVTVARPISLLFAFGTDLTEKSEAQRYAELLTELGEERALSGICVARRGICYRSQMCKRTNDGYTSEDGTPISVDKEWVEEKTDKNAPLDEIVSFIALIMNTYPRILRHRQRSLTLQTERTGGEFINFTMLGDYLGLTDSFVLEIQRQTHEEMIQDYETIPKNRRRSAFKGM